MMTASEIFKELGGPAAVGRAVGVTTEHASTMKRRNSIPVRYWQALIKAARERGIELDEAILVAAHSANHEAA